MTVQELHYCGIYPLTFSLLDRKLPVTFSRIDPSIEKSVGSMWTSGSQRYLTVWLRSTDIVFMKSRKSNRKERRRKVKERGKDGAHGFMWGWS